MMSGFSVIKSMDAAQQVNARQDDSVFCDGMRNFSDFFSVK